MLKKVGIYIHIPFCIKKCNYCDFISYCDKKDLISKYIDCVIKEIEHKKLKKDVNVDTIYIGGGTPSSINEKYIERILNSLKANFTIDNNAEITIEINPGTINEEKARKYKQIGINRISIGLQSASDELLKSIGRIHNFKEFMDCYNIIKNVGFENINVDLMLGLPKQTLSDLEESLEKVVNLNPKHISIYSLIIEENTKLFKQIENGEIKCIDETLERKMYWRVKEILQNNGYKHYEISNFAKEHYESKHNTNCWNQKEYLGMGLSAHSYFNHIRYSNISNLEEYIKNINNEEIDKNKEIHEIQTIDEAKKEFMLLGLRKIDGVNITEFKNKFVDNPIYLFRNELNKLIKENLVQVDENNIKLTNRGIDVANIVWEEFV